MKFELNRLTDYSNESILKEIKRVAELLNEKPLLIESFNKESRVSASTVIRRFGSWQTAILKAGLTEDYFARTKKLSKEEIINELKRVSEVLKSKKFTKKQFTEYSYLGVGIRGLIREFGSFKKAMEAAGFKVVPLGKRYTDEECFENLLNLWTYYGRQPHYSEIKKSPSKVGAKAYIGRWGTWRKVLIAFLEKVNRDLSAQEKEESVIKDQKRIPSIKKREKVSQAERREIRLGLRYEILKRDKFKCVICGDSPAINHRCKLEVDHIRPCAKGGLTIKENLRTLCDKCNRGKGDK